MSDTAMPDLSGKIPPASMTPKRKRSWGLIASFVIFFVLPVIGSTMYFGWVASDRYAASAGFSIRSMDQKAGMDLLGGLTGMAAPGSTMSDGYIVMAFLKSRTLVEKLQEDMNLRQLYASELADPLYRIDPNLPIEKLVDHWAKRITVNHDTSSGIIEFEVDAYRPQDAKELAERVLFHVEELVNQISSQARSDVLSSALTETRHAERRLSDVMINLQNFRNKNGDFDPATTAGTRIELTARLEAELSSVNARIEAVSTELDDDAPTVMALKRQADAISSQLQTQKGQNSIEFVEKSQVLSDYETLQIEKTFAQHAYASAMTSLESARINADSQQRYLAKFQTPATPEYAVYPRRVTNAILSAIIAFAIWSIGSLIAYSVRDHYDVKFRSSGFRFCTNLIKKVGAI